MNKYALINKKTVRHNSDLKAAYKKAKKEYGKGSRKTLKNYLGKVVYLSSEETVGNETRVSDFTEAVTSDELLLKLEKVNLTGMSGNGYPVSDKIKRFCVSDNKRRILIINAVECDPGLLHDEWLLKNRYQEVVRAIDCLKQSLSLDNIILATKGRKVKAGSNFSVAAVPGRYPMGEEHFLIDEVLNIKLEKRQYPTDFGILVLNLQSIYQIYKIIHNCYDGGRFITIADLTNAAAKVAYVYPSDKISSVLQKGFGCSGGKSVYKGTGAMSCLTADKEDDFSYTGSFAAYSRPPRIDNKNKCKNCHICNRKCPAGIKVSKVVQAADKNLSGQMADKNSLQKCLQCGSCTYHCPASKNVSSYITNTLEGK